MTGLSTWDGLNLNVQQWGDGPCVPLLCLPGLVRTGGDFAAIGARYGDGRRVVSLDYLGRGDSDWPQDAARYGAEATLRDVMDICAALHLHRVGVIGTSFGGLLAMGLAMGRPSLLAGVVLNDIGPELGAPGADSVLDFISDTPDMPSQDAARAYLRAQLRDGMRADAPGWEDLAGLTYVPAANGTWRPHWDKRTRVVMQGTPRPLWPLFQALPDIPLLLVHGRLSRLLTDDGAAAMQAARPAMSVVEVENVGHAPTLAEPEVLAALDSFVDQL